MLIVPHQRWTAKGFAMEVSTMLSAAGGRWHRWLVLSGAGPAEASGRAAALVLVMDASEKPDPQAMAAVVKRILGGAEARWVGSTTAPSGRLDRPLPQQPQQPVRDRGGQ